MSAPVSIHIPTALRPECGGCASLSIAAASVRAALEELEASHPSLYRNVCDETGAVRRHINLFVNSSLVLKPEGLDTVLKPGDALAIMTAVSGG